MSAAPSATPLLSPLACDPAQSRGREHAEDHAATRGPRNAYQRDRDRIIHSVAFRRLRHKTQVFIAPDGDHYRVRLTHSLEVAQIGRTIARALALNEDLTEALCLAHDLGHPPFGHAGERALGACMANAGGFDHNGHSLRTVMRLERLYPRFDGLNLSWEMLEGLAKHNGPVPAAGWALAELDADYPLALGSFASLEAQVAAIADDIAYDNHDIDDGLRAGLLDPADVVAHPALESLWASVKARFSGVDQGRLLRELIREHIGVMANDVIETTKARIAALGVRTVDDVRAAGQMISGFSAEYGEHERQLKRFMYANLYNHPAQLAAADHAQDVIRRLFEAYAADAGLLPADWRGSLPDDATARARHICDYVAGMTDRFAINQFAQIYGRAAVPEALGHV